MSVITLKDIVHKGRQFFGCRVKKDMNLQEILEVYAKAVIAIETAIDLNSVRLKDLGIIDTCKLQAKNLLSEILNLLIAGDKDIRNSLQQIQTNINNFSSTIGNIKDEKAKVSSADTAAGYLKDKITSDQSGCITDKGDRLLLMGFAPIGSVMIIDAGRVGDFDGTGKGKAATDVWGWAISNGQNGTRNRLGKFARYVSALADAGNTGGADDFTVKGANLESLTLGVSGTIADALVTPVKAKITFNTNRIADGSGGSTTLLRFTDENDGNFGMFTLPLDLKHSHTFSLNAQHSNPNPVAIPLLPSFISEIPIQRINP